MSTLKLSVDNINFLFERVARDCGPLQFGRELTINGIEALVAQWEKDVATGLKSVDDPAGEVVWDYMLLPLENPQGEALMVRKLCCVDNGTGMTGEEMVKYINRLASSGRRQGHDANFGVGAKISTAVQNPHGVLYLSWVGGKGAMVRLHRDDTGDWGLYRWADGDGRYHEWVEAPDEFKHASIGEHGTMVILLGESDEHDTAQAPAGAAAPSSWVARMLNSRFFAFDSRVTVRAREFDARGDMRTVGGQREYLTRTAEQCGVMQLDGARAHWWILPEGGKDSGSRHQRGGHTAVLYNNELYDVTPNARAARMALLSFGVFFSQTRVVIYLEPQPSEGRSYEANFGRTALLCNRAPLPIGEWQTEFAGDHPTELAAWLQEQSQAASRSSSRSVAEKLEKFLPRFGGLHLRRKRGGVHRGQSADGGSGSGTGNTSDRGSGAGNASDNGSSRGNGSGGARKSGLGLLANPAGRSRGVPAAIEPPEVLWVSATNGTREDGFLDGRAGRYVNETNTLLLNEDFHVTAAIVEEYVDAYEGRINAQVIAPVVREHLEIGLVQRVVGIRSMAGDPHWSSDDLDRALSEEALTAVCMELYWMDYALRRELGTRFGSLKD